MSLKPKDKRTDRDDGSDRERSRFRWRSTFKRWSRGSDSLDRQLANEISCDDSSPNDKNPSDTVHNSESVCSSKAVYQDFENSNRERAADNMNFFIKPADDVSGPNYTKSRAPERSEIVRKYFSKSKMNATTSELDARSPVLKQKKQAEVKHNTEHISSNIRKDLASCGKYCKVNPEKIGKKCEGIETSTGYSLKYDLEKCPVNRNFESKKSPEQFRKLDEKDLRNSNKCSRPSNTSLKFPKDELMQNPDRRIEFEKEKEDCYKSNICTKIETVDSYTKKNQREKYFDKTVGPQISSPQPKIKLSMKAPKSDTELVGSLLTRYTTQKGQLMESSYSKDDFLKTNTVPYRRQKTTRSDCRELFESLADGASVERYSVRSIRRAQGSPRGMIITRNDECRQRKDCNWQSKMGSTSSADGKRYENTRSLLYNPAIHLSSRMDRSRSPVRTALKKYESLSKTSSSPELESNLSSASQRPHLTSNMSNQSEMRGANQTCSQSHGYFYPSCSSSDIFDPVKNKRYVIKLIQSSINSPHFRKIHSYYQSIDRLTELDNLVNPSDNKNIHRILSQNKWQRMINKQKASIEMKRICDQLDRAKERREFYGPKRISNHWDDSRALRNRRYSVEDLKRFYDYFQQQQESVTYPNENEHITSNDEEKSSSLTPVEVEQIKVRLRGIYGSQSSVHSISDRKNEPDNYSSERPRVISCDKDETCEINNKRYNEDLDTQIIQSVNLYGSDKQFYQNNITRTTPFYSQERYLASYEQAARPLSVSPLVSEVSPRTSYSAETANFHDPNQFTLVLNSHKHHHKSIINTASLSKQDRADLVERSENLKLMRNSRLRRPLSLLNLDHGCSTTELSDENFNSGSSEQTVIERRLISEAATKPRSKTKFDPKNLRTRSVFPDTHTLRSSSAPPGSYSVVYSEQNQTENGEQRLFSLEYLPEKSMSSIDIVSAIKKQRHKTTAGESYKRYVSPPYRSVSFSTQTSPPRLNQQTNAREMQSKPTIEQPETYWLNINTSLHKDMFQSPVQVKSGYRSIIPIHSTEQHLPNTVSLPSISGKNVHDVPKTYTSVKKLAKQYEAYEKRDRRTRSWSPTKSRAENYRRINMREKIAWYQRRLDNLSQEQQRAHHTRNISKIANSMRIPINENTALARQNNYSRENKISTIHSLYTSEEERIVNRKFSHRTSSQPDTTKLRPTGDSSTSYGNMKSDDKYETCMCPNMVTALNYRATAVRGANTSATVQKQSPAFAVAHEDYRISAFKKRTSGSVGDSVFAGVWAGGNTPDCDRVTSGVHSISSYQQRISAPGVSRLFTSKTQPLFVRAMFNFTPISSRELALSRGDVIVVRRAVDTNWLEGELRHRVGIFPINYVEAIPLIERLP